MPGPTTVDEYLATLAPEKRAAMEQLRGAIRAAAPAADEVITYKMPGFKTHGQFLVSYDAFKSHYSLFPASDAVVRGLGPEKSPTSWGAARSGSRPPRPSRSISFGGSSRSA